MTMRKQAGQTKKNTTTAAHKPPEEALEQKLQQKAHLLKKLPPTPA